MIPLFKPASTGEEARAVARVMKTGWWAQGPETELFEDEFARYTGTRYAVAVNSGTMALKLAARATGLVDGLVVCPALTFISTALAMHQLGNRIVFADVHETDLTMNWYSAKEKLNHVENMTGPYGVVPVWYAGRVMTDVPDLPACTRVIEDCAHAAGSTYAGHVGRVAAWSFHAVKNLACGDGGMITTDDEHVAREVRRLRWVGIDKTTWDRDKDAKVGYGWDYDIKSLDGEKGHMNDLTAAIGRVQLKNLDAHNALRREVGRFYHEGLSKIAWLRLPQVRHTDSAHLYVVRVPAVHRPRFIQHMISNGVSAGVHYKPLTHYEDKYNVPLFGEQEHLPITEQVWQTLVTLPLYPTMKMRDIDKVIKTVRSFAL